MKALGETTAQAVLLEFGSASVKRRDELRELLSAAVERIGEGHNGAKAG